MCEVLLERMGRAEAEVSKLVEATGRSAGARSALPDSCHIEWRLHGAAVVALATTDCCHPWAGHVCNCTLLLNLPLAPDRARLQSPSPSHPRNAPHSAADALRGAHHRAPGSSLSDRDPGFALGSVAVERGVAKLFRSKAKITASVHKFTQVRGGPNQHGPETSS